MSNQQDSSSKGLVIIITSIIGVIGTITVAYFAFRGAIFPAQLEIEATQTAQSILSTQMANNIWITQTAQSIEATKFAESIMATQSAAAPMQTSSNSSPTDSPVPPTPIPASPIPSTLELQFMSDESGWVTQGGQVGTGSEHPPQAGDFNNNAVARGFLSFDLTGIPSNATIQSAKLILPESAEGSGDVFPNFGSLTFEAVWYGLSLNPEAFDSPSYLVLQNAYGPTSVIGVTASVEKAIQQGYRRFQIRFSFSLGTDNDGSGENYWIPDSPSLEVIYMIP